MSARGPRFCGPKLSACGLLLSIWGVLQLGLMAVLFYVRSVALVDDLPLNVTHVDVGSFVKDMEDGYDNLARNCLITTACYVLTFFISAHQFWVNSKPSPTSYANFDNES